MWSGYGYRSCGPLVLEAQGRRGVHPLPQPDHRPTRNIILLFPDCLLRPPPSPCLLFCPLLFLPIGQDRDCLPLSSPSGMVASLPSFADFSYVSLTRMHLVLLVVILAALARPLYLARARCTTRLPPGPKSSWFGGVDLPREYQWLTYAKWKEIYGGVASSYSYRVTVYDDAV